MEERSSLFRSLTIAGLIGACGAALAATGLDLTEPEAAAPAVTVKVVDAQGVERTVDPGAEGIDFAGLAQAAFGGGGGGGEGGGSGRSWKDVSKDFEAVISTTEGRSFYGLWINRKTNQMLAELPRGYENQKHFFAMTVSGGEIFAGLQAGDLYVYWKRYGEDRIALVSPQIGIRSTKDDGSKDSVERIFTDTVILDVPILTTGPNGQPVIDMDALLVGRAGDFFGGSAGGLQARLAEIDKAKAFPDNVEIAFKVPDAAGTLKTFHYSISNIRGTPNFRPREADARVGYFTTSFRDLGQVDRDEVATRYVNRWHIEKADPSLKVSPPKDPIVYYIEHTVPVRYRRWVKAGVDYWNAAYREIGIEGAIEVRYQDKRTGAHMEKDPEDVRYNFIRWLNNDISTAIGPSRVNPLTGEILDADVVLTDGWLRVFTFRWNDLIPELAMEGFDAETLEWLATRPQWDPRVRLAAPGDRRDVLAQRTAQRGVQRFGGHALASVDPTLLGDDEFDGLIGRVSQVNGMCAAASGKGMQLATARMHLIALESLAPWIFMNKEDIDPESIPPELLEELKKGLEKNPEMIEFLPPELRAQLEKLMKGESAEKEEGEEDEPKKDDEKKGDAGEEKPDAEPAWMGDKIDGMPEEFVGPMLAELVAHEVGHTLGLRHNFKGSSAYTMAEINSDEMKGKLAWSASVMDYNGINIRMPLEDGSTGDVQGDFSSINLGPYDVWAIEYGYTDGKLDEVLKRAGDPMLDYGTDEDSSGPDPLVRRYDLSKNPLDFARNQMALVEYLRKHLMDKYVGEGDSWAKARQGYSVALSEHVKAVSMMANWVGGAHVYRTKKGDETEHQPIEPVPAEQQRAALEFVIDNTFYDDAFGLTPELLRHMTIEKWFDGSIGGGVGDDNNLPVHDQVLGIQSSALTMILNPTVLRRVHDNQYLVDDAKEGFALGELMRTVTDAAWQELMASGNGARRGDLEISSLRQNLQREHVDRLIDMVMPGNVRGAAAKPVAALAAMHLREIHDEIGGQMEAGRSMSDEVKAHLSEVKTRIAKSLDAQYIYNTDDISVGGGLSSFFFQDGANGR